MKNVSVVLLHNNIINKHGNLVETSVTNIDVHDIARTVTTYELDEYAVVTRLNSQQILVNKILDYWVKGKGGNINQDRKTALNKIVIYDDIKSIIEKYKDVKIILTDAKKHKNSVDYSKMSEIIKNDKETRYLLVFGTGWGLDDFIMKESDYILEPIQGKSSYNHLSVRAAAAIIIDRLFAF